MVVRQRPGSRPTVNDRGSVTAETAVVLVVLGLVLATALWAVAAVAAQLRCVDAAREGARAAARGDSRQAVLDRAGRTAPRGAAVTVTSAGPELTVRVRYAVPALGGLVRRLPEVSVTGTATARTEAAVPVPGPP